MFESINNLKLILNIVLSVDDFNNLWNFNDFFFNDLNFLDINILRVDLDDLFNFNRDFLDNLFSESYFDDLVNVFFYDFVNLNQLRNNSFEFNNLVLLNEFFNNLFNFNNLWYFNN